MKKRKNFIDNIYLEKEKRKRKKQLLEELKNESNNMADKKRNWKNDVRLVLHALDLYNKGIRYKDIS